MRVPFLFVSLLLLCGNAVAGGTVGFNVKWYSTPGFPFNDIVDGGDCEVTTGVVIADFNRDGIPDVAYSYNNCGSFVSGDGGVIAKLGTGGGNLGPDINTDWALTLCLSWRPPTSMATAGWISWCAIPSPVAYSSCRAMGTGHFNRSAELVA
jgi:hypothetical protein